jgi:hypothetical protein
MTITIKIPGNLAPANSSSIAHTEVSSDYVTIDTGFLKHLHKSFVKISSKDITYEISGGFIDECTPNSVFLRVPAKKDTFEIPFSEDTLFQVKGSDPNYLSLIALKVEESKYIYLNNSLKEKEKKLQTRIEEVEKTQKYLMKKNIVIKL